MMKTRLLITCGLLVAATLFADSTVVKDTVAIADSSHVDTLSVSQLCQQHNQRLKVLKQIIIAKLDTLRPRDITAADSTDDNGMMKVNDERSAEGDSTGIGLIVGLRKDKGQ